MNIKKNFVLYIILFLVISLAAFFVINKQRIGKVFKIGITQIVEHESLDKARQGFIDELKNLGYCEDKNVKFDIQIAGGDLSNCESIAQKFVSDNCDLILAISTPAAQAAANATKDIPILVTAITNPEESNLVESNNKPNTNVTGTSDLPPIEQTIDLMLKLKPGLKKIGVLYSNIDVSPSYQAKIAEKKIKSLSLEPKIVSVSQIGEVEQVTRQLIQEVDAIYVPLDKITAASLPLISNIALEKGKFVACSENIQDKGALLAYGIDYYELGKKTAHQAVKILENKSKPQDMPIEYLSDCKPFVDKNIAKKLKIKIPDGLNLI